MREPKSKLKIIKSDLSKQQLSSDLTKRQLSLITDICLDTGLIAIMIGLGSYVMSYGKSGLITIWIGIILYAISSIIYNFPIRSKSSCKNLNHH